MEPVHDGLLEYHPKPTKDIMENLKLNDLGKFVSGALKKTRVDTVQRSLSERSTILEGNIEHAKQLVEWMEDKKFSWQLCYRASRDGWGASEFHAKCDDVGPTVTLVKCGTNIFGGFTDQSWNNKAFVQYKRSNSSFLFSLKNKENMRPFKYPIKDGQNDKAIRCSLLWGAAFGGSDLVIGSNANRNQNSFSNLGYTYQPPPGYEPGAPQTKALLAGSIDFTPSEIEVFHS
ncbi:uncharacterized protein LOC114516714 [Dendronephthya gigantea]|uniref:uncharacterized protein LOC114516714 n=1 Tax=Dendronephthya gigantea TaxID=151771 RepID=UPI00106D37BB|nr:uncharacterized protein LOC114516714 [Dendronephthya gigantea]